MHTLNTIKQGRQPAIFHFYIITAAEILLTLLFSGCYTYQTVSEKDFFSKSSGDSTKLALNDKTKIILKNKNELLFEDYKNLEIKSDSTSVIIKNASLETKIKYSDISKILQKRPDSVTTFFVAAWISVFSIVFILLILILSM